MQAAIKQAKGEIVTLPLWLFPTQIRILPISDKHNEKAMEIAQKLKDSGIRVDVDDAGETLDKNIRNAETEWIPYICVLGDKEIESGTFAVRVRATKKQEKMTLEAMIKEISDSTSGMPKSDLSLPMLLSKRPSFVG